MATFTIVFCDPGEKPMFFRKVECVADTIDYAAHRFEMNPKFRGMEICCIVELPKSEVWHCSMREYERF